MTTLPARLVRYHRPRRTRPCCGTWREELANAPVKGSQRMCGALPLPLPVKKLLRSANGTRSRGASAAAFLSAVMCAIALAGNSGSHGAWSPISALRAWGIHGLGIARSFPLAPHMIVGCDGVKRAPG